MCLLRPVLARLAPHVEPDVPPGVARDGVQHSFAAYSDALHSLEDSPLADLLRAPTCPVTVVLAEDDQTVLPNDVLALPPAPQVRVVRVAGDHGVAHGRPDLMAELLVEHLDRPAESRQEAR
jgi:pimeloyl-ACP methyl ester carboxylesterase